jgi:hypothetical protein
VDAIDAVIKGQTGKLPFGGFEAIGGYVYDQFAISLVHQVVKE